MATARSPGLRHPAVAVVLLAACLFARAPSRSEADVYYVRPEYESAALPQSKCKRIQRCLRNRLPKTYRAKDEERVIAQVRACVGGTPEALWVSRSCFPFRFGNDERTGNAVEVDVSCRTVCPDDTRAHVRFSALIGPAQCACLGADAHYHAYGRYQGCSPTSERERNSFKVEANQTGPGFRVYGGVIGDRLNLLGISQGNVLLAFDGQTVESREQVTEMLAQLPNRRPASLNMIGSQGHRWDVYYVTRGEMTALERLADEVALSQRGPFKRCSSPDTPLMSITTHKQRLAHDPTCRDEDATGTAALVEAIARAAKRAAPAVLERLSPAECRALEQAPVSTTISTTQGNHIVELRWVDYLAF